MVSMERVCARAMARFSAEYRSKGCPVPAERAPEVVARGKKNERWRRITGMTVSQEPRMDRKERHAGLAALAGWIEAYVRAANGNGLPQSSQRTATAAGTELGVQSRAEACTTLSRPTAFGCGSRRPASSRGEGMRDGGDEKGDGIRVDGETGGSGLNRVDEQADSLLNREWACAGQARELVAAVCGELNLSKQKLSALLIEYRGIGAVEFINGLRLKGVRTAIAERLKLHARDLWLTPGHSVNLLISDERLKVYGGGGSEYFVDATEEFQRRELWETQAERRDDLLKAFDAGWRAGGQSRDGFAVKMGFRSFAELNRACLNVFGQTVRELAWEIGCEIVQYYLAKEWKVLRELALQERVTPGVARARYLYHGSTARPDGDVCALWDSLDEARRGVLERWLG